MYGVALCVCASDRDALSLSSLLPECESWAGSIPLYAMSPAVSVDILHIPRHYAACQIAQGSPAPANTRLEYTEVSEDGHTHRSSAAKCNGPNGNAALLHDTTRERPTGSASCSAVAVRRVSPRTPSHFARLATLTSLFSAADLDARDVCTPHSCTLPRITHHESLNLRLAQTISTRSPSPCSQATCA